MERVLTMRPVGFAAAKGTPCRFKTGTRAKRKLNKKARITVTTNI